MSKISQIDPETGEVLPDPKTPEVGKVPVRIYTNEEGTPITPLMLTLALGEGTHEDEPFDINLETGTGSIVVCFSDETYVVNTAEIVKAAIEYRETARPRRPAPAARL